MGWFDDIVSGVGDFLGNVTGNTQTNRAAQAQRGAMSGLQTAQNTAGAAQQNAQGVFSGQQALGGQMQQGVQQSMGANAADYQQKALASAQKQAAQQAQMTSTQGAANAASAARASGVNAGQAGLGAGQQASSTYASTYVPAVTAGINQYQAGTGQMMEQGQMAQQNDLAGNQQVLGAGNLQAGAAGTMGQLGMQQQQSGQQQMNSFLGGIGSLVGLKEGGEVENSGKAFPLLVESGERVEVSPYKGPDVSRIWGEAKNTLLGISGANYIEKRAAKKFGGGESKSDSETEALKRKYAKTAGQKAGEDIRGSEKEKEKENEIEGDVLDRWGGPSPKLAEGGDILVGSDQTQQEEVSKPKEDVLGDINKILSIGATIGMLAMARGGTVNYGPEGGAIVSGGSVKPLKAAFGVEVANMAPTQTNYVGNSSSKKDSDSDNSDKHKPLVDLGTPLKQGISNLKQGVSDFFGGGASTATPAAGSAAAGAAGLGAFANGADFIVPPGYDNDTYPLTVMPGTHVKVTPKNEVKTGRAIDLIKKKQLLNRMQSSRQPVKAEAGIERDVDPDFPANFTSLMNKIFSKGQ